MSSRLYLLCFFKQDVILSQKVKSSTFKQFTHSMFFMLKPLWKCVGVWIVNQGVITVTPGKFLSSDAKMIIRHKRRRFCLRCISKHKSVDVSKNNDWASHEEEYLLPHFPSIWIMSSRHRSVGNQGWISCLLKKLDITLC